MTVILSYAHGADAAPKNLTVRCQSELARQILPANGSGWTNRVILTIFQKATIRETRLPPRVSSVTCPIRMVCTTD